MMSLKKYSKKRNFDQTPEPSGKLDRSNQYRFVIQRHQASHLHYDLRLELEGVLKSWAVPKGPSLQAGVKRLAIQTEDHPVSYLHFEGRIPKGNYGAGVMDIWDSGTYRAAKEKESASLLEQWTKGSLKIIFEGKKMKGEFALIRTGAKKDNKWLFIKKEDPYSTKTAYDAEAHLDTPTKKVNRHEMVKPGQGKILKPMLATPKKEIFNHPDWVYELKWDGYRMLSYLNAGQVQCYSRNGKSFNEKFPTIVHALEGIPHDAILDGEVVALDKEGVGNFQILQHYPENEWDSIRYYVFDLLFLNGHSTLELGLMERKSLLPEIIADCPGVMYCEEISGMGTAFYQQAIEEGMEGVIAKKADSIYQPGHRSEDWLKIKAQDSLEAVICGYTASDKRNFGALILGIYEEDKLLHIGNCGSGFTQQDQKSLLNKLQPLHRKTSPFAEKVDLKGSIPHWVTPRLIAEVNFSEWTKSGKLRHPVFKTLRTDKNISEVHKQQNSGLSPEEATSYDSSHSSLTLDGFSVPITNLDKIYWPKERYRKYELLDYYLHVAQYILPYLKDRPQNLHRNPNGIKDEGFYQKNVEEEFVKPWMETVSIYSKSNQKELNYVLCQQEATLLYLANLGCIEFNPWSSRIKTIEKPDYAIIDLDPTKKNTFQQVIETALATKEILEQWKIKAFCKTSGSTGIHILFPLGAQYTYKEARDFAKLICLEIQKKLPKLTTLERPLKNRKERIYLDYLQNGKAQTLAAPYCVRPREGAPVSAPIEWGELKSGLEIRDFTIKTMPERLEQKGDIFGGLLHSPIDMLRILNRIKNL